MNDRAVAAIVFVACAALYAPIIGGHFLSDDMAVIYVLTGWQEHGERWSGCWPSSLRGSTHPATTTGRFPSIHLG